MEKIYFTVAGTNHYFGNDFLKPDMKVKLTKEPDVNGNLKCTDFRH